MKAQAPATKGKTVIFSITVPETLARRIEKKLGKNAADALAHYFTELAVKDIFRKKIMKTISKLEKIPYKQLNSRQKENYNFHKLAAILADYGFNSIRLSDDWKGADFLACNINGSDTLKVQLKGKLTIAKKYLGKNIYIAFPLNQEWYLIPHDKLVRLVETKTDALNAKVWKEEGIYHWPSPPKALYEDLKNLSIIEVLD